MPETPPSYAGPDRRTRPDLRAIFDQIVEVVKPLYAKDNPWNAQHLDAIAHHAVIERFPELSAEEAYILSSAARALCENKRG